jgi:predicted amidohydrolase YtcJ
MPADVVFRVGRAYGMTADRAVYQAVAVTDGRITAAERSRDDLDSFIGPGTTVIDDPELVLYPAFADTHSLVTRGTRTVGVQGPQSRVDAYTAIWLYTAAGGRLLREDDSVGILAPGAFADIVGFRGDLLDGPVDDLPSRQPALTLAGGRAVYDPDGLFGAG